jgi:hypothetical protein
MKVTGVVLSSAGEFYALEFRHSDTDIFWLIERKDENTKTCAIPTEP